MITQKYDVSAIARAHQIEPHFLSCSRDGKLIMRRDKKGDFKIIAHDQETIIEMSATDARDFAVWILMANATTQTPT
jgi:hypothetical protein